MLAPMIRKPALYQALPCKKSKENNNIIYDTKAFWVDWARRFHLKSSVATQTLDELFSRSNELLTGRLDNLMKIFKRRNANLYSGYQRARIVVDSQAQDLSPAG
ncbi:MAG: hypothetical protein K9I74_08055 [Bacteroidales bacterium]|nr:hypothetical protein [Bacteroidales bacterium]